MLYVVRHVVSVVVVVVGDTPCCCCDRLEMLGRRAAGQTAVERVRVHPLLQGGRTVVRRRLQDPLRLLL